jgi:hypothetical protein
MTTTIEDSLQAIQSPKIRAIVARSASKYIALMANQEPEIVEAMQEVEEGKPFTMNHTLSLNLYKNRQTDRLAFSVKHSIEADGEIPNPDQLELVTFGEEAGE